jgi:hypothetical protein
MRAQFIQFASFTVRAVLAGYKPSVTIDRDSGVTPSHSQPDVLDGRRRMTLATRCFYIVVALAIIGALIASRRLVFLFILVVWTAAFAMNAANLTRHSFRVDSAGVWRPAYGRRRRLVPWTDVAAVQRPNRYDTVVVLLLTAGSSVPLLGIDAAEWTRVAGIGGRPTAVQLAPGTPAPSGPGSSPTVGEPLAPMPPVPIEHTRTPRMPEAAGRRHFGRPA